MAYTKQNFEDGQVLKAEHLIKIEDGLIAAEPFYVPFTIDEDGNATTSATYAEIVQMFEAERLVTATLNNAIVLPLVGIVEDFAIFSAVANGNMEMLVVTPDNSTAYLATVIPTLEDLAQKIDASELPQAINEALAQAKASGRFDGKDGTSVTVSNVSESTASGGTNTVTFSDGKEVNIKNGKDGSNGTNGTNGTSATHSWNGTTLTVTSASGTSSANLKGDKGDKGDAYTLTSADKTTIVNAVIAALPVYNGEVV